MVEKLPTFTIISLRIGDFNTRLMGAYYEKTRDNTHCNGEFTDSQPSVGLQLLLPRSRKTTICR